MKMTYAEYINEIISYNGRYKKLKSVGTWLDLKTGYTFAVDKNNTLSGNKTENIKFVVNNLQKFYDTAVHGFDCTDEWIQALSDEDTRDFGILMRLLRRNKDHNCYEWNGNDVHGFWISNNKEI
tara:strand:+ start:353 stop:724 length:372 start_codon:yes stop_codon:yes gene_type:complete